MMQTDADPDSRIELFNVDIDVTAFMCVSFDQFHVFALGIPQLDKSMKTWNMNQSLYMYF